MSVWKVFSDDKVIRRLGTSSNREQRQNYFDSVVSCGVKDESFEA